MKYSTSILLIALAIFQFSCSSDDDDDGSSYDFKDQIAQGAINDTDWTMMSGYASISNDNLSINLFGEKFDDPCNVFSDRGTYVFFTTNNEVKLRELKFDLDDAANSQSVTFYDPDAEYQNSIASRGAIEILSITDTEVTGRIDARFREDGSSAINGNFTVEICK